MTADEQTLRTQLTEARQEARAADAALQEKHARVKALEAAVASRISPVPLGAIIEQKRKSWGTPQGTVKRYRVVRLETAGHNDSEARLILQPINKDGSDRARSGPTVIYGDYTVVSVPAPEEPTP